MGNLSITEIAKAIRKDLRNELSEYKFSTTTRKGISEAINIDLKSDNSNLVDSNYKHTSLGKEIFSKIKAITDKYNYDNSDVTTDYFDVRFYCFISLS